jgi:membrane protein YdbS with pleckstrin-like domain
MNKPRHLLAPRRVWMLPVLVVVLLAGHGVILYYVSSHVMLSAAVLSGAIILLVIKHVGLLRPLYALFRRRRSGHEP